MPGSPIEGHATSAGCSKSFHFNWLARSLPATAEKDFDFLKICRHLFDSACRWRVNLGRTSPVRQSEFRIVGIPAGDGAIVLKAMNDAPRRHSLQRRQAATSSLSRLPGQLEDDHPMSGRSRPSVVPRRAARRRRRQEPLISRTRHHENALRRSSDRCAPPDRQQRRPASGRSQHCLQRIRPSPQFAWRRSQRQNVLFPRGFFHDT